MAKVGAAAAQKKTTKTASTPAQSAPVYQAAPDYGMAPLPQPAVEASVGTALSYPATERNYYSYTMSPEQIRQASYRMMNDRKYGNFQLANDYDLEKERARVQKAQSWANRSASSGRPYSGLTGYRAYSPQEVVASVGNAQTYPATERNYYSYTMSPAQIREQAYNMMLDRKYGNFPLVSDYDLEKERARVEDYLSNHRKF